jgi:hypothetical protein
MKRTTRYTTQPTTAPCDDRKGGRRQDESKERSKPATLELGEKTLRRAKVGGLEALGELVVGRGEKLATFLLTALFGQESGHRCRGAELPPERSLALRAFKRAFQRKPRARQVRLGFGGEQMALDSEHLGQVEGRTAVSSGR